MKRGFASQLVPFRLPDERYNRQALFAAHHLPGVVFLQPAAQNQVPQAAYHFSVGLTWSPSKLE